MGDISERETPRQRKDRFDKKKEELAGGFHVQGGGSETLGLALETRACYISGPYRATVILGATVIDHMLNRLLIDLTDEQTAFEEPGDYPGLGAANKLASRHGIVTDAEHELIDDVKKHRDAHVHYREIFQSDSPTIHWMAKSSEMEHDEFGRDFELPMEDIPEDPNPLTGPPRAAEKTIETVLRISPKYRERFGEIVNRRAEE